MAAPNIFIANPYTEAELTRLITDTSNLHDKIHIIKLSDINDVDVFYYNCKDGYYNKIFEKFMLKIKENGEVEEKEANTDIKSLKDNLNDNLNDELFKFIYEKNKSSNNYVVINLINIIYNMEEKEERNQLIILNNMNFYGILYMMYRSDKNNDKNYDFMYINSKDVFERTSLNTLIDDLLDKKQYEAFENPDNYKKNEIKKETVNNNIYYRFLNYIKSYYDKLRELNKSKTFITYEKNIVPTIDGVGKKIYFIGDIHGDFPRLVQLLYNAKFITFRGPAWAKVNLFDSGVKIDDTDFSETINDPLGDTSIIQYINGKDIFKEVVWLAENTLFISTGDLVDSVRKKIEKIDADNIGDYELRIHLLLMILREQAINKNSFIHFVIGNHDVRMINKDHSNKYVNNYVSDNSIKYFKSLSCRSLILSNFYIIYPSFCIYIKYHASHVIFTAHGSLYKFIDYNLIDNTEKKLEVANIDKLANIQFNKGNEYSISYELLPDDLTELVLKITEDRKVIENFYLKKNDVFNAFAFKYCNEINRMIIDEKDTDKARDNYTHVYYFLKNNMTAIHKLLNISDYELPKNNEYNPSNDTYVISKLKGYYETLKTLSIFNFTDTNFETSLLYQEIQSINKNITHCVFGHSHTTANSDTFNFCYNNEDFLKKCCEYQSNDSTHNILSTLADHIFFVDIALSKCFDKRDNNYFELLELDAKSKPDELTAAHLRIYTAINRYQLGAPRQAELFKAENPKHFIPQLKPIGDYFTPIMT
jgi:hypothetical protein